MSVNKNKRKIIGSSAALLSILIHIIILFIAGGVVALRYFSKEPASFTVTEQKKIQEFSIYSKASDYVHDEGDLEPFLYDHSFQDLLVFVPFLHQQ